MAEDIGEKMLGLRLLMEHSTGKTDWQFDKKILHTVAVFKMAGLYAS